MLISIFCKGGLIFNATLIILSVYNNVKVTRHYDLKGASMKNIIRELRREHKLTQEQLSVLVNVSRQSIVSIETGKYNPSLQLAYNIAKQFDLTIEEVFIFEEENNE